MTCDTMNIAMEIRFLLCKDVAFLLGKKCLNVLKKSVGHQCPAESAVFKSCSHIINNASPGQTVSLIQLYMLVSQAVYIQGSLHIQHMRELVCGCGLT